MSLTKGVLTVVLALLPAAGSFGVRGLQEPAPITADCPVVDVSCPDALKPGEPVTFVANISGGDPNVTPTFKWKVSGGRITGGQDTSAITVDASEPGGRGVTATVEVGGYHPACTMSDSCTLMPGIAPTSRKVDEYGGVRFRDEKARLDNLAAELRNDPTAQGYFICYGGRRTKPGEARRLCERARNYHVSVHEVDLTRVVNVDGGRREVPTVEFWIVPSGAQPPQATPTIFPEAPRQSAPARATGRWHGRR